MVNCGHDHTSDSADESVSAAATPTTELGAQRPSWAARPILAAVRAYQLARADRPSPCRFVPSCSTYAVEALQAHGALKGSWLSIRRLGRCQPWGGQGYDPVPPRSTWNTADAAEAAPAPDQKVS